VKCPQLVIAFYESRIDWFMTEDDEDEDDNEKDNNEEDDE